MSGFVNYKQVNTRKEHVCHGCERKYPKGITMDYVSGVHEDHFFAYYLCKSCDELIENNSELRDFISDGFIEGAVKEYCEDEGIELPPMGDTEV